MAAGDLALSITISAVNQVSGVIGQIAKGLYDLAGGGALGAVTVGAVAAGAALVSVGAQATSMAGDFNSGLTSLVTGAGEAQSNLVLVGNGIKQLAIDTGTSTSQLTSGMYMIESAGYHGAAGLQVLQASAEGAKVGNADLGTVANATTTIMTDFGIKSSNASVAVNALIATVANGKTTMGDLSSSLSQILPTAAAAKVGLQDVMGAMATMTGEGVPAADAATYLRQTIIALDAPSKQTVTALQAIGLSSSEVANEMQISLPGALKMITDAVGKKFPEGSAEYVQALKNISGGSKQMQGMLDLTGEHMAAFQQNVGSITSAVKQGGNSITGWSLVQQDFNTKMAQAGQAVQVLMINIGEQLLPGIANILSAVTPVISGFADWVVQSGIVTTALRSVGSVLQWLFGLLSQIGTALAPIFNGLATLAAQWGQNFMTSFGQSIMSGLGDIVSAVVQVVTEIENYLGFASPAKKGPGANLNKWAQGMMQGFANGIAQHTPLVSDAVSQAMENVQQFMKSNTPAATMAATTSQMADAQTGASRTVTMTPVAQSMTSGLSSALAGGTSKVASAAHTLGSALQPICHTHAKATSQCAGAALTTGLASHLQSGKGTLTSAAHTLGTSLHAVCGHAHTASTCAHTALTHGLASGLHSGKGVVSSGAHAVGSSLHVTCSHAHTASKCASTALTHGLATGLHGGRGHVTSAAHTVGGSLHAVCGHAQTASKCASTALTTQLASQIQGATSPVQAAATAVGNTIQRALTPVAKVGATFAHALPGLQAMGTTIGHLLTPAFQIFSQVLQGVLHAALPVIGALVGQLLPALFNLASAIAPVVQGILQWIANSGIISASFQILGGVISTVIGILSGLINGIATVVRFFQQNQVAALALLIPLGALGAYFAVVAFYAIALATVAIPPLIAGFITWATTAAAAAIAQLALIWPILAIGAAIGLLIGIIILLVTHWGQVVSFLRGVWSAFTSWFMGVLTAIGSFFTGIWKKIAAFFTGIWTALVGSAKAQGVVFTSWWHGVWQGVQNVFSGVWTFLQNAAKIGFQILLAIIFGPIIAIVNLFNWLYQHNYYFKAMIDAIVGFVRAGLAWLHNAWQMNVVALTMLWKRIASIATAAWALTTLVIRTAIQTVVSWLQGIWNGVTTWIQGAWHKIASIASAAWGLTVSIIQGWITTAINWLQSIWNSAATWIQTQWNKIAGFASSAWQKVSKVFSFIWTAYIASPLSSAWKSFSKWFGDLIINFGVWATNALKMFGQKIMDGIHFVLDPIGNLAGGIAKFLGFHSPPAGGPLASSGQWMGNMMSLFSTSIQSNSHLVTNQITLFTQNLSKSLQTGLVLAQTQFQHFTTQLTLLSNQMIAQLTLLGTQVKTTVTLLNQQFHLLTVSIQLLQTQVQASLPLMTAQFQTFATTLQARLTTLNQSFTSFNQTITQWKTNFLQALLQVGQQVIQLGATVVSTVNIILKSLDLLASTVIWVGGICDQQTGNIALGFLSAGMAVVDFSSISGQALFTFADTLIWFEGLATTTIAAVERLFNDLYMLIAGSVMPALVLSVTGSFNNLKTFFGSFIEWTKDAFAQAAQSIAKFAQQIQMSVSQITSSAASIGVSVASLLGHSTPSSGPLANDNLWGQHFVENLTSGMQRGLPSLTNTTNAIASTIAGSIKPALSGNTPAITLSNTASNNQPMIINLNLDGKTIGKVVTTYQAREVRIQGGVRGI